MAADAMSEQDMAFFLRHTSGVVCVALPESRARDLDLPQMVSDNCEGRGTAFTVSVDHRDCGTGISAADRALTIRRLATGTVGGEEFVRPGHVFRWPPGRVASFVAPVTPRPRSISFSSPAGPQPASSARSPAPTRWAWPRASSSESWPPATTCP